MDLNDLKMAVDYFERVDKNNYPLWISGFAAIISVASLAFTSLSFKKQHEHNKFSYLANIWHETLNSSFETPFLSDRYVTSRYFTILKDQDLLKYNVFCYKAWGHVEDIITAGFGSNEQFEPIMKWVTAYHYNWLRRNPTFFTVPEFWNKVEEVKNQPMLVFGYQALPSKNNEIDWDTIAPLYDDYILSPFAPEMVIGREVGPRNHLLTFLKRIPKDDFKGLEVADFGCGPGNLVPYLFNSGCSLTGFDISASAINIAAEKAKKYGVRFTGENTDYFGISAEKKFDIIISVNSILPRSRAEVIPTFRKIRDCLKPSGKAVMILPSFDTTEHLLDLWVKFYSKTYPDKSYADRIASAFRETKKMSYDDFSYADDGQNAQCYHTPLTIRAELKSSGLRLVEEPQKIFYPWNLTKKFDYGYFPDAAEEIWDWFIIVERAEMMPI